MTSWVRNARYVVGRYVAGWDRGMARGSDVEDKGLTARLMRARGGVFDEDREIPEAQQHAILANPDLPLDGYTIDRGGVRARRIIARIVRDQAAPVAAQPELAA